MVPALWVFFILLNGKFTLEILLTGLVVALAGFGVSVLLLDWSLKKELAALKRVPMVLRYLLRLLVEIFKANLSVVRRVYRKKEVRPAIVTIPRRSPEEWKTVVEANSITLTPGTITMRLAEDSLTIHCLDEDFAEGLADSVFAQRLTKMGDENA